MQLIEARKAHGFTQAKLAKELGVSRTTVTMWETGEHQPSHEMLVKLASLLNTSTDYLLGVDIKKEPTTDTGDGLESEVLEMLKRVPPERMDEVKRFLRFQAEQKEKP